MNDGYISVKNRCVNAGNRSTLSDFSRRGGWKRPAISIGRIGC